MGNYNSQYENYYSALVNKRKGYGNSGYTYNKASGFKFDGNFLLKRLLRDLIGVFILFVFVISCKLVVTPQTTAAYNYSKKVLGENYDYKKAISSIKDLKSLDVKAAESKTTDWFENIKSKITGGKTLKDKIKTNFLIPVEGNIISRTNNGVNIDAKADTEILCPSDGKIKECGENGQLGKYIVIDHGNGIETKYGNLNDITVKKDDSVKKGEVIGKTGGTTDQYLHFEILYMGENENPEDYLDFSKNKLS